MDEVEKLLNLVNERYHSVSIKNKYYEYISTLQRNDLPIILSFSHFADILEITKKDLHGLSFRTELYYKSFDIPKKTGGFRKIFSPNPLLFEVQNWILKNILKIKFKDFPSNITGYINGQSIVDHVNPHKNSKTLIKFDIKDFFPSIKKNFIYKLFINMGYSHSVSKTISSLLTLDGALPQGAPTSPYLSNIYMAEFDELSIEFCKKNNIKYTRYADDIVFSGSKKLLGHISSLNNIFNKKNIVINNKKTKIYKENMRVRFITGLIIHNKKIRLPKQKRRLIRAQCHHFIDHIKKLQTSNLYDNENSLSWSDKNNIQDPLFSERILGKLNYWLHIEPNNAYVLDAIENINLILRKIDINSTNESN